MLPPPHPVRGRQVFIYIWFPGKQTLRDRGLQAVSLPVPTLWELSLGGAGSKEVGCRWDLAEGEVEPGSVTVTSLPVPQGLSLDALQSCSHLRPLCPGVGRSLDPSYPKWGAHSWAQGLCAAEGDSQKMSRVTTVPGRDCSTGLWRWVPGNTPLHPSHTHTHTRYHESYVGAHACVVCSLVRTVTWCVFAETAEGVEGSSHLLLRPRGSPVSASCTPEPHSLLQEWSIHWKLVFRKTKVFILVNRLLIQFPMPCSSSWGYSLQAVGLIPSWPLCPWVMFWAVTNAPQCGHFSNFSSRLWASGSRGQWVIQAYSITDRRFHLLLFYLWLPWWPFLR